MRNILNEIKWAWQRVVRGYDDRVMWGLDEYFLQILEPLREFCMEWSSRDYAELNPDKLKIFAETVILIDEFRKVEDTFTPRLDAQSKLFEHVGKHVGYYWD